MEIEPLLHQTLAGKYRVDSVVSASGMGVVLAATHVGTGERVAVKLLGERLAPAARERFVNEARAVARLRNPHVAKFKDIGTLPEGTPYFAMELLEGKDLGRILEETYEGVGADVAVDYILQACEALAEAHAAGIVHRDIKPANLFLAHQPNGQLIVKVLDFGIARAPLATGSGRVITEETVLGTPAYMSPEQMRSARHADVRSDIWALGAVLYQLIEGETPFDAETFADLCLTITLDPPMPMQEPVPPGLARAIARCLEKEPAQRFANVGELARAIVPYVRDVQQGWLRVVRIERMLALSSQNIVAERTAPGAEKAVDTIRVARARLRRGGR